MSFPTKYHLFLLIVFIFSKMDAQINSEKKVDSLLTVAYFYLNSEPQKAVNISKSIYESSVKARYGKGITTSLLYICQGEHLLSNYKKSIDYATKTEIAGRKYNDFEKIVEASRFKSLSFNSLGYHENAKEKILETFDIANKIQSKNTKAKMRGFLYQTLGIIMYTQEGKNDSALYYDRKVLKEFYKIDGENNDDVLASAYNDLGSDFLALNKLDSSEYYLKKALIIAEKYKRDSNKTYILKELGYLYHLRKEYSVAVKYYSESIALAKKGKHKLILTELYLRMSESLKESKDFENSMAYMNLYVALNDSILKADKKALSVPMKEIIKQNKIDFNKESRNLYRIIIVSVFFTFVCIYVGFVFYKKFKKEELTHNQVGALLKEKMEHINQSLQISNEKLDNSNLEEILILAIKGGPFFEIKFQELFPNFKTKMTDIAPTIVASELKFAAYIKLDFNTKEIARYTNTSVRAVEAKKYRLRKKLNIPTDEDTNIWMSKI